MGGFTTTTISGGSNRCSDRCREIVFGRKSSSQVFAVVVIWVLTLALCDGEQNGVNGGEGGHGDQKIVINPTSPMMADDDDDNGKESIGYAAEWEYEGPPFHFDDSPSTTSPPNDISSKHPPFIFPNRRVGPGTWHDPTGNWWLFGGQSFSSSSSASSQSHYLSDLWLYSERETRWNLIFRPEVASSSSTTSSDSPNTTSPSNSNPFTSAFPENLSFPLLCGSIHSRRLAIYGANPKKSSHSAKSLDENTENLPFSEDNIVWLYDSIQNSKESTKSSSTPSTWTSYVCCDACLPDGNATTNFEYCPQFTKDTLSWCDHSGIMMLQTSNPVPPAITLPKAADTDSDGYSTAPTIFSGLPKSKDDPSISPPPGGNLNWWKFDVDSTEWIKLPPVTIQGGGDDHPNIAAILSSGQCRVVSTMMTGGDHTELVYILCPSSSKGSTSSSSSGNLLDRTLILFDPARGTASKLPGGIHLNRAFSDKKVWLPGRSTLHAISIPEQNKTLIFLAYQKLLDLWIHDHLKGRIYQVENVWKGDSLRVFQNVDQFYKLTVTLEGSPFSTKFFMANPRNPVRIMESYEDKLEGGHFRIMIVPDKEVFLPQRDASFLNEEMTKPQKNSSIPPPPSKDPSKSTSPKIPPETIKMPIKRTSPPFSSSTPPPPPLPSTISPELLQKMEEHRKNKYRTDSRSPKLKNQNHSIKKSSKIPGIIIKKPTLVPVTMPTTTASPSSPLPLGGELSSNKSSLSFSTTTIKPTAVVVDLTSSQISMRKSSHENNDLTSTSLPPSSSTSGRLSVSMSTNTNTSTSSNSTFLTKSQEISSEKVKKAITPKPLVMMMMAMMKPSQYGGGGGVGGGGISVGGNGKMAAMKIKSFITTQSPTPTSIVPSTSSSNSSKDIVGGNHKDDDDVPSNIWRKPNNLSARKREESLEINEQTEAVLVPTAEKLLQKSPSSSSSLSSAEQEDDHEQVEMADAVAMETTSRSSGGDDGPEAEGDIDDNHIRSPGSMVIGGGRSEVEPKMWRQGGSEQRIYESGGKGGLGGDEDDEEGMISSMVNPTIFFAVSLSFFATIGVVLFVRRCVKCPPRESESALIKEPPPMRYSVIPDDLSFHLPIV